MTIPELLVINRLRIVLWCIWYRSRNQRVFVEIDGEHCRVLHDWSIGRGEL